MNTTLYTILRPRRDADGRDASGYATRFGRGRVVFCSIVIGALTNRRPFWARAVTLACSVVFLLLCASLLVANEARADLVGGTLDVVGGSQPAETASPTSETPSENTTSAQPSSSSQEAPVEDGTSGGGSTSQALADPVGTLGGAVEGTVGATQPVVGNTNTTTADASSGVLEPVSGAVEGVAEPVGQAVEPVGQAVTPIFKPVGGAVEPVVAEVTPVLRPVGEAVEPVVSPVTEVVEPVLEPVKQVTEPVLDPVSGVTDPVVDVVLPESDPPGGDPTQEPDGEGTPGGTPGGTLGDTPGNTPEGTPEPRTPVGAPPANDGALVQGDYPGRVASDATDSGTAGSGPMARQLDSGPASTRYATHASPPVHDATSAAIVSAGPAQADVTTGHQQRSEPWFFEAVREELGAAIAEVVGSGAFSSGVPFSAIGGALPLGASLESAGGSAFATGFACCLLLLYSISRTRPKWASSRVTAPSEPLRLITERPG